MKIRSLLCRYVETVKQQKKRGFRKRAASTIYYTNKRNSYVKSRPIVRNLYSNIKKNDINMKIWVTFQEVTFLMFFTLLLSGKRGLYSPVNFFFRHYASE